MKKEDLKGKVASEKDALENGVVNIHKDRDISLDKNTIENLDEERYPTQDSEKEFEVSLHFQEDVQNNSDIAREWIKILKDSYIKDYLEKRKKIDIGRKTEQEEGRAKDR